VSKSKRQFDLSITHNSYLSSRDSRGEVGLFFACFVGVGCFGRRLGYWTGGSCIGVNIPLDCPSGAGCASSVDLEVLADPRPVVTAGEGSGLYEFLNLFLDRIEAFVLSMPELQAAWVEFFRGGVRGVAF